MNFISKAIGIVYWAGLALLASRAAVELKHKHDRHKAIKRRLASIEEQPDASIHATEIDEWPSKDFMLKEQAS